MFNYNLFYDIQPMPKLQKDLFKTYKLSDFTGHKKRVSSMAWNRNGSKLITGSADSQIRVSFE